MLDRSIGSSENVGAGSFSSSSPLASLRTIATWILGKWEFGVSLAAIAAYFVIAMVIPSLNLNVFNSPDETSNYFFTRELAENGRLWYSEEYSHLDQENLLHPRGTLTHNGRIVPFNYLGLPVLYAPLYKVAGENLQWISLPIALAVAWAIYRTSNLLFGAKAWQSWTVVLGFTPLLHYLNHPYMNATPALLFVFLGLWAGARYYRYSHRRDLFSPLWRRHSPCSAGTNTYCSSRRSWPGACISSMASSYLADFPSTLPSVGSPLPGSSWCRSSF